jgi:hypothetical protein
MFEGSLLSKFRSLIAVSLFFVALLPFAHGQDSQSLDNDAIVKMQTAGLGSTLIVQTINASPGHYDTSTDGMIALKKAGISDAVIGAMIAKNANPAGVAPVAAASGPALPPGVDEVGVYYKDDKSTTWTEFKPEIVNYKSGGAVKSAFSYGIVKQDKNGHVPGKASALVVTHPMTILIYAPEGTAPNEYQLLKLRVNSDNREFRSETGGVFHKSSGAERDRQDFTANKIGPRLYTFTLAPELKPGEYGILPPGAITSANSASAGKIDTFQLKE